MIDSAGTSYTGSDRSLFVRDPDGDEAEINLCQGGLLLRAPDGLHISDAKEFIRQVANLAGLEVIVGKEGPLPAEQSKPKRPHDFAFDVVPRARAIKVTEEYARSDILHSGSKVAPKFDERRGTLLGVEVRESDGEMTGRVAEVGDYLVFTPTGVEIVWGQVFEDNYRKVDA